MLEDKNQDPSSLIKVLDEKDKIIVSLKEASKKIDQSNESQIRILSVDGEKKADTISSLKDRANQLNLELNDMKIKLVAYEEKKGNFEQLKQAVENYRQNISTSLKELKNLVSEELTSRDNKNEATTQQLRNNYQELENKMAQAQAQYKTILAGLFDKQKMAKTYIRKSLTNIQEALNMLDTNSTDLMIDDSIYQNFSQLMSNSQEAFAKLEDKNKGNKTIIENIENLNLQLQVDEGLAEAFNAIGKSLVPPSNSSNGANSTEQTSRTPEQNSSPQIQTGGGQAQNPTAQPQAGGGQGQTASVQPQTSGRKGQNPTAQPQAGGGQKQTASVQPQAGGGQKQTTTPQISEEQTINLSTSLQADDIQGITSSLQTLVGNGINQALNPHIGEQIDPELSEQPGFQGTPGSGSQPGFQGTSGIGGQPGFQGTPGSGGQPGFQGTPGIGGQPGFQGTPGIGGQPGFQGTPGSGGQPGFQGTPGSGGQPGFQGTPGIGGQPGFQGTPGSGGQPGFQGTPGSDGQPYPNTNQPTPQNFGDYQQTGINQQFPSQGTAALAPEEDLIMRDSPNLAPYNWNMLASTSTLLRFRKMLNSAIRAEEKENWTKALYIYNTVKVQRTVKDDALAINMLEDQIEAINRRARSSVSNNAKRDRIIDAYEKRKNSDK